ncbi:MAG: hypothetical protein Q4B29_00710 [Candidatus Saccharibacteria bacterium]|nr:hypothetical protein [Candidatus Saccharibacteria bacterium]
MTEKGDGEKTGRFGGGKKVAVLVVALVLVVLGGVLFVGATAGWFGDSKVELSSKYDCGNGCAESLVSFAVPDFEKLVEEKESFILFIDQGGCQTADKLRGFLKDYLSEKGIWGYTMLFSEMRESSLYGTVKFYPSVVVFKEGEPIAWMRADADEDAAAYNEAGAFREWINKYI